MTREEAIRRLKNMAWLYGSVEREPHIEAIDMAIEALSDRPTDEWCTDCKEYDHEKHCCPRFNRVIRTTLDEAVANLKSEFESAECEDYEHATLVDIKEPLKVLVVRCKDCRYQIKEKGIMWCSHEDGVCGDAPDNFYCAYGEKEDE